MNFTPKKLSLKAIAMALFLTLAVVFCANASGVDMTGTWNLEVTTPNGNGAPVFTLKQDGQKLTGTYTGRFGEEDVTGSVNASTFEINYESSGVPIKYSGNVDGDTIMGDIDFSSYGTGTFTGKRK